MTGEDLGTVQLIASALRDAPHWPRSAYEIALDPLARPQRIALVAVDDRERVAGFAIASLVTGAEAELESIAVEEPDQRRGVARALFQQLADRLRQRGVAVVFLEVRESNEGAREFYRALGFLPAGRRPGYYADPAEDAMVLRLTLS
jgi:ribosomal-protein-alanine N-acetyltransferase